MKLAGTGGLFCACGNAYVFPLFAAHKFSSVFLERIVPLWYNKADEVSGRMIKQSGLAAAPYDRKQNQSWADV